jgi:hypothetical protein
MYTEQKEYYVKMPPEKRAEGIKDLNKQKQMLARELIAAQFYSYLLGDGASPAYSFAYNAEGAFTTKAVFVPCEDSLEDRPIAIRTHFVEVMKILAASYLLMETDLNAGNLLLTPKKTEWAPVVRIDYDHSFGNPDFFPLQPADDLTWVERLCLLNHVLLDDSSEEFKNWLPALSEMKCHFRAAQEDATKVAEAEAVIVALISRFAALSDDTIQTLIDSGLGEFRDIAPEFIAEIKAVLIERRNACHPEYVSASRRSSTPFADALTDVTLAAEAEVTVGAKAPSPMSVSFGTSAMSTTPTTPIPDSRSPSCLYNACISL